MPIYSGKRSQTPQGLLDAIFSVGKTVNRKAEQTADDLWNASEIPSPFAPLQKAAAIGAKAVPWLNPIPEDEIGLAAEVIPFGAIAAPVMKPLTAKVHKVVKGLRAQEAPVPLQKIINLLRKEGLSRTELEDAGVPALEGLTRKGNIKPSEITENIDELAPSVEPNHYDEWDEWTPEAHKKKPLKEYEHTEYRLTDGAVPKPTINDYEKGHMNFRNQANYPLFHSRSSQLTTPSGDKTRYVSEVQSDLHQAASHVGYSKGKRLEELPQEQRDAVRTLTGQRKTDIESLADDLTDGDLGVFDDGPLAARYAPRQTPKEAQRDLIYYISRGMNAKQRETLEATGALQTVFPKGLDAKTKQAFIDLDLSSDYGDDAMARFHLSITPERYAEAKRLQMRLQARGDALKDQLSPVVADTNRHPYYGDDTLVSAATKIEPELDSAVKTFDDEVGRSKKLERLNKLRESASHYNVDHDNWWNYVNKEPAAQDAREATIERLRSLHGVKLNDYLTRQVTRVGPPGKPLHQDPKFKALQESQFDQQRLLREKMEKITELLFRAQNKANVLAETGQLPFVDTVPDIPFKKTWERQALKDELRRAVGRGETKFAIANPADLHPGVQPKAHFDNLTYDSNTGILSGTVKKTGKPFSQPVTPDKLSGYVGNDVARELTTTGTSEGANMMKPGFRAFYEEKLPAEFEDILTRHGIEPRREDTILGHTSDFLGEWSDIERVRRHMVEDPEIAAMMTSLSKRDPHLTWEELINMTPKNFAELLEEAGFDDYAAQGLISKFAASKANITKTLPKSFKPFTLPTPTWDLTDPKIKEMVEQGFPLGALLAGVLGYGAYQNQNQPALEQGILGM